MARKKSTGPSPEFEHKLLTHWARNYHQVFKMAEDLGWYKWGSWTTSSNGSHYQCFRRGNDYAWIGCSYIERRTEPMALPFMFPEETSDEEIIEFLKH